MKGKLIFLTYFFTTIQTGTFRVPSTSYYSAILHSVTHSSTSSQPYKCDLPHDAAQRRLTDNQRLADRLQDIDDVALLQEVGPIVSPA